MSIIEVQQLIGVILLIPAVIAFIFMVKEAKQNNYYKDDRD